ncbi:MAG: hypothetical protein OEX77_01250 [Candidatus Bathyarchaeota archaeon]|nr:hypothetical protein [Candidatus Bathyarchaeota archaeon]MDH5732754.1 hypothetical protein [Candidatus Bathyarchaeota archaeon]
MSKKRKNIKAMADLLRQGATLTELSCPACSSPLFKMKSGDLWCANCQKRVIVMKEGESLLEVSRPAALTSLEATILLKIQEVEKKIREETDFEQLNKLGTALSTLLENLQTIRKIKGNIA